MILPEINSGMQALILGYGVSGKAAERLLNSQGVETTVLNNEDEFPQGKNFDFAITSPGIPLNHKWHLECNLKGIPIASELSLAAKFWRGHIMAITGSKGKSSIVKLIADTLNNSGLVATACGNYGLPFCDVAFESHTTNDWAIVEVSSFQMETTEKEDFHPEFAAAVNLQEDHIDRHGSVDVYHECKLKLLESANIAFVSRGCKAVVKGGYLSANQMRGNVKETEEISESFINGTYFGNSILKMNTECAISLMKCVGLSDEEIISGLRNFKPLPHRMCVIGEWNGVKYIDDSKATSLAAMVAAIKMAENGKPIHLIAGGLAKGDDPNFITKDLSKSVKKVYLIGSCANQFFEAWKNDVPCKICETLDRAVDEVMRNVCTQETVLLSPGTASFDQFKSYGARGDMFASLVRARVIQSLRASPKEDEKNMKSQTLGLVLGLNVAVACLVLQGCKANKPGSVKPAQDNVVVIDTNEPSDIKDEKPVNNAPETIVVEDEKPVTPVVVKPVPATPPPAPKKQITVVDKAPAASTETTTYVVCAGDTLSGIAVRYNIKMQAILAVNPGMNPNRIYVGKKIKLPGKVAVTEAPVKKVAKASATPATAAKTTAPVTTKKATPAYKGATKEYTVKSGDILGKIAQSYGISIRALKELNGLKNNNIRVGQVLKVPAEKVVKKEAPKKPAKVDTANEVAIEPKKDVKKPAEVPAKVEEKKVETESATTVTTVEEVTVAPQVEAPAPDPKATEVAAPAPEHSAAPAAAQPSTYVVKEGQDILSIAVDFGISPTQLLDANNLKMTDPIKPGDVLKLPAGVKPANAQ